MLLLAALLHDLGKGRGVDHSVFGAELSTQIGTRLGIWPSDIEMLANLVRHHLLLSIAATRHDLNDPQTIASGGPPRTMRRAASRPNAVEKSPDSRIETVSD